MKATLRVQYVGGSDEESAHLRLLLRKARSRLQAQWTWDEDAAEPDLLLADPATLAGDAALVEARNAGRPFISVVDRDAPDSGEWQLRRPLKADALVRVVNALTPSSGGGLDMTGQDEDFFSTDLGEDLALLDPEAYASIPTGAAGGRPATPEELEDFEALFKRDPLEGSPRIAIPTRLGADTTIEAAHGGSARSEARREQVRERLAQGLDDAGRERPLAQRSAEDLRILALVDFLDPAVLPAPARTTHGGLVQLVLDPKQACFHSPASLEDLELYCLQMIPVSSWERLTSGELAGIREQMPVRPWAQLRWLYRLLNSNQRLARHLDPGGRYWLTGQLDLGEDYPGARAIAAAMEAPLKLNEIAERAGTGVGEVINVVNAFDAIGLLGWELRDRLRHGGN